MYSLKKENERKRNIFIVLLLLFITFALTACSQAKPDIKPVMSPEQINKNIDSINTALLNTQGTVVSSTVSTKVKKIKKGKKTVKKTIKVTPYLDYDKTAQSNLAAQVRSLQKVIEAFEGTNVRMGYPKSTLNYAKQSLAYVKKAEKASSPSDLKADYHKVVRKGVKLYRKVPRNKDKKSERIMATLTALDYSPEDTKKADQQEQSAKQSQSAANNIFYPKSSKGISFGLGMVLIVLSALLILFVFLQPSKANDAMNALTDTAGNDLLSEAKPDDYTIFLMRGTEIIAIAIVVILGFLEFRG